MPVTPQIGVRMSTEMQAAIREVAQANQRTFADMCRILLSEALALRIDTKPKRKTKKH